jgi:hypothetical protein
MIRAGAPATVGRPLVDIAGGRQVRSKLKEERMSKKQKSVMEVVRRIQEKSKKRTTDKLSDREIQAEIDAVRRERRLADAPVKARS